MEIYDRLRTKLKSMSGGEIIKLFLFCISITAVIIIELVINAGIKSLGDQYAIENIWARDMGYEHISGFFDPGTGITGEQVEEAHHRLDTEIGNIETGYGELKLSESCYSEELFASVATDRDVISNARIIAAGGEYFYFHPLKLIGGTYFEEGDLMDDSLILDDLAALRLFGSTDIVGQQVYIGDRPFRVVAVYETENTRLSVASGADKGYIYMPYSAALSMELTSGITVVEFVAASSLKGSLYNTAEPIFTSLAADENHRDIVVNTGRFSRKSILRVIGQGGARSMRTKPIVYPFYENEARAMEDFIGDLTRLELIFVITAAAVTALFLSRVLKQFNKERIMTIVHNINKSRLQLMNRLNTGGKE